MILYEDAELEHALYVAEINLNRRLMALDNYNMTAVMKEMSTTTPDYYIALNEGVKDAIMKFIQSVTQAITKAWNAFKEKRVGNEVRELIIKNKDKLNSIFKMLMPKEFEVANLDTWEHFYTTIHVKEFGPNYDNWKQQKILEKPEDFIKSQYPELVDGDKSPEQIMREKIFRKVKDNEIMSKENIQQYSDYLLQYPEQIEAIGKDVDSLNASNKNIEEKLSQIVNASTEYLGSRMLDMLFEADVDNKSSENKEEKKDGFRSADPNDNKVKDDKTKEDRKYILTYYKASTKIFSSKLKVCNAVKTSSQKLVTNFIKLQNKGDKKKEEKTSTSVEVKTNSTTIPK